MKKLLSALAQVLVLAFSLIPCAGCGNSVPDLHFGPPARKDTSIRHLQWRIDSLVAAHFPGDGPGVVLDAGLAAGAAAELTESLAKVFRLGDFFSATGLAETGSKNKITGRSVFNIGSLTKQFTARAVMTYTARISLSDPVGKYLSGLKPPVAALTIGQLLSHCSGIPDHYGYTDTNKIKHATNRDVLNAVRNADRLYFPAGTRYRYSNTAYCLLGMLLEKLSGVSYDSATRRTVDLFCDSSQLQTTGLSFLSPSAVIGDRVHGYEKDSAGRFRESDAPESIFFTTQADGGALISMEGYNEWCRTLVTDYQLGIRIPEFEPHTLVDTAAGLFYGYGWFVLPGRSGGSGPLIYHTGFNGGFRSAVLLMPKTGYHIAIFSAAPQADLEELIHQVNVILGIDDKGFIPSGPLES